jgi:hypothetical protein
MRLTPAQIDAIKSTATAVLGEGAQVTLFGSRVNDTAKGGDVDLMIEVLQDLADPAVMSRALPARSRVPCMGEGSTCSSKRRTCWSSPFTALLRIKGLRSESR